MLNRGNTVERDSALNLRVINEPRTTMKTQSVRSTLTLAFVTTCIACAPALAQFPGAAQAQQPIEAVTPESQSFAVGHLAKKPVRSASGESLGEISEFLIDPKSGRVHFAVVYVGNDFFRIVPMNALQPGSGSEGLVLAVDRATWDKIPPMNEQQLLGPVSIDAAHQQQLQQHYQLPAAEPPANDLLRATLLNERELRVGNDRVGTVDDVVIDFHNRISAPLVRMKKSAGGEEQRVLVHFSRLQVNPEPRTPIVANLTAQDLDAVGSLTPTGYPSGFGVSSQTPQGNVASAVQQAIERDASVPRGAVAVIPEHRVILRGVVENEQKRTEVERAAQQAAPGVQIVNQLMVQNR